MLKELLDMKTIPIKTTKEKFYRQFLEVLRNIPPVNKLRPKELDVLSQIMKQADKYRQYDADLRNTIIFSTNIRKEMRDNIGINEDSFNNNLSVLRRYKILSKDNVLNPFFDSIVFEDKFELSFIFKV